MDSPNIGKESVMEKQETKEEVLEYILQEISKMSRDEVLELIRFANEHGFNLKKKEPRE